MEVLMRTVVRGEGNSRRASVASRGCLLLTLLLTALASSGIAKADVVGEYDLKAALLVKVTAFVTWPALINPSSNANSEGDSSASSVRDENLPPSEGPSEASTPAQERLCIGIVGTDPFGPAFDDLLDKANTERRTMTVRRVTSAGDAAGCQVIFVAPSARPQVAEIIASTNGAVLTVADFAGFAAAGGMVEMALDGKRISLTINRKAVEHAGLTVSSKLLSLAHVIDNGDEAAASAAP